MMNPVENRSGEKQPVDLTDRCNSVDEIDLVDLWLLLARHKVLILAAMVLITLGGFGYSFMQQENYTFSTSINVGRSFAEGGGSVVLLEPIETIQAKLTESYIPMVLGRFAAENKLGHAGVGVRVNIPKGSHLLVLESRGSLEKHDLHREVHESVLAALQEDHQQLTDDLTKSLETTLAKASLKLDELEDPRLFSIKQNNLKEQVENAKRNLASLSERRSMISLSAKDLDKLKVMLEGEAQKVREGIEKNLLTRAQAAKETNNALSATTLLMMDSQIQQSQTRLQSIQERLELGLAAERRQLDRDLSDNQRTAEALKAEIEQLQQQQTKLTIDHENELAEHKQTIAQLQHNISLIKNTRALALAVRSVGPVGPKKSMVVALAFVLGGMMGVFLAFAAEFRQRVRAKKLSMSVS